MPVSLPQQARPDAQPVPMVCWDKPIEVKQVALLVGVSPRRVEGWVERGLICPTSTGGGPGRRRLFNKVNVAQARLLAMADDLRAIVRLLNRGADRVRRPAERR